MLLLKIREYLICQPVVCKIFYYIKMLLYYVLLYNINKFSLNIFSL